MYKFEQTYDNRKVTVELNEPDAPAADVFEAFIDFMVACGFLRKTVEKVASKYGEENV